MNTFILNGILSDERVDLTHAREPRSMEGYWIQSTGEFTDFEEIGREGSVTIYGRRKGGKVDRRRN